jgi:hypothetical protein
MFRVLSAPIIRGTIKIVDTVILLCICVCIRLYYVSVFASGCTMYLCLHLAVLCICVCIRLYYVSVFVLFDSGLIDLDAGRLARSQNPEGPATGHSDTGFSWFSWVLDANAGMVPNSLPSYLCMLPM